MKRAARIDDNQPSIVQALEAAGCTVQGLASMGGGVPDLLVGRNGLTLLLEVKDGNKPPSRRKLTADERLWHEWWRGQVAVVESPEQALAVVQCADRRQP
jgi:hypothetical protein